ncbi:MAG: transposase [Phycisphaerae bacterium]
MHPDNFDWRSAYLQHRDHLPHLRQENALYFVTFRLADSLPAERVDQLRMARDRWMLDNPSPHTEQQEMEYRRLWTGPIERLLDAGYGECVLCSADCRDCVEDTMRHEDGTTYSLGEFVIMPNHVHVLVHVPAASELSAILQAWKSISARRINRRRGRRGTLWQSEPFDHIVRDRFHHRRFADYIRKNPAKLKAGTFTLGCGSLVLQ